MSPARELMAAATTPAQAAMGIQAAPQAPALELGFAPVPAGPTTHPAAGPATHPAPAQLAMASVVSEKPGSGPAGRTEPDTQASRR